MRMRKRHLFIYFASVITTTYEKQQELNKVWALKWVSLLERVRNR